MTIVSAPRSGIVRSRDSDQKRAMVDEGVTVRRMARWVTSVIPPLVLIPILFGCDALSSFFNGTNGPADSCDAAGNSASIWCVPHLNVQLAAVQPTLPTLGVYVDIQAWNVSSPQSTSLSLHVQEGSLFDSTHSSQCVPLTGYTNPWNYEVSIVPSTGMQQASLYAALVLLTETRPMPQDGSIDGEAEAEAEAVGPGAEGGMDVLAPGVDSGMPALVGDGSDTTIACPGIVLTQTITRITQVASNALPLPPDASTEGGDGGASEAEAPLEAGDTEAHDEDAAADSSASGADTAVPSDGATDGD